MVKQEAEVARYSGGLVKATASVTLATMRQTQAMLDQKRLALKYGLPQFVGFKDMFPSAPGSAPIVAVAPSVPSQPTTPLPNDCMKVVFGAFCLGGPGSALPPNGTRKDNTLFYTEPETTAVTIVDERAAAIGRFYKPGTWLTYNRVESDLVEKYGKGKDLSFYPSYANDSSSKETSISLKTGRAIRSWQQVGFTIQLKWEDRDHVTLLYFHDDLEAKRAAKKKDQY